MYKIIFVFLVIFVFNYSHASEEKTHQDRLLGLLELIQEKFPFSTHEQENVANNQVIFEEVSEIIEETLKTYPEDLSLVVPCIRLLYIQGNHYLYRDSPVLAQKKLLIARGLCEKWLPSSCQSPEEICHALAQVDGRLPSFYAMTLRLLGKAYIFPSDFHHQLQKEEGETLLRRAVQIREYIDTDSSLFQDAIDNNESVGNTHIFKRDLAYVLIDQGNLDEAEKSFLELIQVDEPFNRLMCLKRLLMIYHKKGQRAESLLERQNHYKRTIEIAVEMLPLVESHPEIYRISFLWNQLGQLYVDPQNPFCDFELSRQCFERAKQSCPEELKSISILLHQGLSRIYQEMASSEEKYSKQEKWDYEESSSATYLKESSEKWERQAAAYEELGDLYFEQKEYEIATTLYSNSLSILRKSPVFPESPLWVRLTEKMAQVEKAICPALPQKLSTYVQSLSAYRNRLEQMRKFAKNMMGERSVEEIFAYITSEYKKLIQQILKDLKTEDITPSFALICGGSMSWNVATPYSDVELAFLIDPQTSEKEKKAIEDLSTLLTLRISAIGETPAGHLRLNSLSWLDPDSSPSPRGMMLDPFQLSSCPKYFIGTPVELVSFQKEGSCRLSQLRFSFIHASCVLGDPSLLTQYQKEFEKTFDFEEKERGSRDQLKRDLTRWEIKQYKDALGERCSLKHDLYRTLDTVLYDLAFRFGILDAKTPWELFKRLEADGYIDHEMTSEGLKILDLIGHLRVETYLEAHCQREWIDPNETDVVRIRHFLKSLHEHVKVLAPDVKIQDSPPSDSIEASVKQLASNQKFYGPNHPIVAQNHASLATSFVKVGHYHEAAHEFQEAIRIDRIMYGTHHPRLAPYYAQLALCQTKMDSEAELLACHSQCKEKYLVKLHPSYKVRDLEVQALLALEKGDSVRANELFALSQIVSAALDIKTPSLEQ